MVESLPHHLRQLVAEANAVDAVLLTRDGGRVSSSGSFNAVHPELLSSLEHVLSEDVDELWQAVEKFIAAFPGEKRNYCFLRVGERHLLVVPYDHADRGKVTLCARECKTRLIEELDKLH